MPREDTTPIADRIVQAAKRDMLNTYGGYNEAHARTTILAAFRALANEQALWSQDTSPGAATPRQYLMHDDLERLADDIERGSDE